MNTTLNYKYMFNITNNDNDSNYETIKTLIIQGVDIHMNNDNTLCLSAFKNNPKTIKLLLDSGCNIHTNDDETFILSVVNNNIKITKYLLKRGANVNANNGEALKFCSINNNTKMIKLLIKYGAKYNNVLNFYITNNNIEIIKLLLNYNIDINKDKLIMIACCNSYYDKNYDMVKLLIDNGAKLDIYNINPITWCIERNNIRIIKLLIDNHIRITEECIDICVKVNNYDSHLEIIKLFNNHGMKLNYIKTNPNNKETIKYINENYKEIKFRNSDICPISYESLENQEKLGCINCLNVFKKEVLNQWLNYNNICPMCKQKSRFQDI